MKVKTINGKSLMEALRNIAAKNLCRSDWRKASNGRLVRFVKW